MNEIKTKKESALWFIVCVMRPYIGQLMHFLYLHHFDFFSLFEEIAIFFVFFFFSL